VVEVRDVDVDVLGHVFREAVNFQRCALAHERSALQYTGCLADQLRRNAHPDLPVVGDAQEVCMENDLAHGMELHLLENCLGFESFDVQVYKVRVIGVNQLAEKNHRRIEVNLLVSSVKNAGYMTLVAEFARFSLAEICS